MQENLKNKIKEMGILKIGLILITYIFILCNLNNISGFFSKLNTLLMPFFFGFVISYLLNPFFNFIKRITKKIFKKELKNSLNLIITYIIVFIIVVFLCIAIFPQIWYSINVVIKQIPNAIESLLNWWKTDSVSYLKEVTNNKVDISDFSEVLKGLNVDSLLTNLTDWISTLAEATWSFTKFIVNLILGLLISIYMLANKDMYRGQAKKIVYAFLNDENANRLIGFFCDVNTIFSKFINARILDSTIIGVLCFICCKIFGFNNALLISFIVGITNVIPYIGPFLGAIPSAFIVLIQSPMHMIGFIVFILVLQQFDGQILGPRCMGSSLELTSLWILFAVIIMTGLCGPVGMFIGVPLFAIIYMVIKDCIYYKLYKKGKSLKTEDYVKEGSPDYISLRKLYKEQENEKEN